MLVQTVVGLSVYLLCVGTIPNAFHLSGLIDVCVGAGADLGIKEARDKVQGG